MVKSVSARLAFASNGRCQVVQADSGRSGLGCGKVSETGSRLREQVPSVRPAIVLRVISKVAERRPTQTIRSKTGKTIMGKLVKAE